MTDWFEAISAICALPAIASQELQQRGFTVVPNAMPRTHVERLSHAYDAAMASATATDLKTGSTTTRLGDFVNRGEEIDALYIFPPLLDACCRVIGRPFKLSSLHARTLRPHSPDVGRDYAEMQRTEKAGVYRTPFAGTNYLNEFAPAGRDMTRRTRRGNLSQLLNPSPRGR